MGTSQHPVTVSMPSVIIISYLSHFQGYFEALRTESLGTGISVTLLCPGPVFSNLLQAAATEKAGEVRPLYLVLTGF